MNNYHVRMEEGKAFLCCGKAGCPSVSKDNEGLVVITDDYGSTVKMKEEEAELIHHALAHVNDNLEGETSCEPRPEKFGIQPPDTELSE